MTFPAFGRYCDGEWRNVNAEPSGARLYIRLGYHADDETQLLFPICWNPNRFHVPLSSAKADWREGSPRRRG